MRVSVVGAGVVGLCVALRLRDAGVEVTLLERSIPGAEASSAAAGMLAPQREANGPGAFLDLCLRGRDLYPAFAAELSERAGLEVGYLRCGTLWLAFDEKTLEQQRRTLAWQRELGLRVETLDRSALSTQEPTLSSRALGALLFPDDHQVDNRLLVRALAQAATRASVSFRTGYVRGLVQKANRVLGVDLDGVTLESDAVVIAAGSWTGLVPGLAISPQLVRPAKGQMVELQLRAPPFQRVVYGDHGYVVPRADGRVICGSTVEHKGFDKRVTVEGLAHVLGVITQISPALADATVVQTWAGLRPYTEDHLPILGAGPLERLFLATGHFRNGILLAPLTGQLIADAVLGKEPGVDLTPFSTRRSSLERMTN